jgi:hypothetical protein
MLEWLIGYPHNSKAKYLGFSPFYYVYIQKTTGGNVDNLGGHSINYPKEKYVYVHV